VVAALLAVVALAALAGCGGNSHHDGGGGGGGGSVGGGGGSVDTCGNGALDPGEACDDGNRADGDCCSSTCEKVACSVASGALVEWEELGPRSVGGRVSALAVDPSDPRHLMVGAPAGGVWGSEDGGATWSELAPWLTAIPLSALAIDPSDGKTAVAGTGAIDDSGSVTGGVGVIRTTDGGKTWTLAALSSNSPLYVSAVLIWPGEPERVLAATDTGVMVSTDSGATFADGMQGDGISVLVRDPFDAEAVYAAGRASLFRSPDRGQSWKLLSSWPIPSAAQGGTVALAASSLTSGLLYATVQVLADAGGTAQVLLLQSTNGGTSFSPLATPPNFCPTSDSCGFAQAIALDPLDDRTLLVGGDRLYVSRDAGSTWNDLGSELHGVHALALLSSGGGLAAGVSGLYAVDAAFASASARNDGLAVTAVLDLDVSSESLPRILAATGDSGTLLGVTGDATTWTVIHGAGKPAGPARFDPSTANRLYASEPHGLLFRSDDGGAHFNPIQTGLALNQVANAAAPLEPSPLVPGTLYTGREQVFVSTDAGNSWSAWRPPGSPEVLRIAPSPLRATKVYFSLSLGPVLYFGDGNNNYTSTLPLSDDQALRIEEILPDKASENILYAAGTTTTTSAGHVYRSYTYGANWDDAAPSGFPAVHSLVKDSFGALYAGTASGVYRSGDDGYTWVPFKNGLHAAGINKLRIAGGYLYAATSGRGVFRIPIQELVSIDSIPPGMPFLIDGKLLSGPVLANWPAGSSHTVAPYLIQTDDERQSFVSWSDGGAQTHVVHGTGGNLGLTAAVRASYRLRTAASPAEGGTVTPEQPSSDGFYDAGTFVQIVASPAADHRLTGWSGDLNSAIDALGLVVMDQPRSATAQFTPLELQVKSQPSGLTLRVDGQTVTTPASYRWTAESVHPLSAPDTIDLDPSDPVVLAFDHWTDLLDREHDFAMLRDTFITDLTAAYIPTVPALSVPAGGAALVRTPGQADAPRVVSLQVQRDGGGIVPEPCAILSGSADSVATTELVLVPTTATTRLDTFVEGGGPPPADKAPPEPPLRGFTRLVLQNPGAQQATVTLAIRIPDGSTVFQENALTVAPGTTFTGSLHDLIQLDPVYEGLLSVISDQPLLASVQSVRQNLRTFDFLDPLLVVPFTTADWGVAATPEVQVLLRTPSTEHRLVLFNPGNAEATGTLGAFDESGAALAFDTGGAVQASYDIPAGGYAPFRFHLADAAGGGGGSALATARVELASTTGPVPQIVLVEERDLGPDRTGMQEQLLPRTLPPSRSGTTFAVPVDLARRDSGLILSNTGTADVDVTLSLDGLDGLPGTAASVTRTIPAGGQAPLLASELFPGASGSQGLLIATATGPVLGVAVLRSVNSRGEELLAGWPAWDGAPSEAPSRFPFLIDGDSWSTQLWLAGPADAAQTVLDTRGLDGSVLRLPVEWP
jgi:cysteine-rich repeat protein